MYGERHTVRPSCNTWYVTAFHISSTSFGHPFMLQLGDLCVLTYILTISAASQSVYPLLMYHYIYISFLWNFNTNSCTVFCVRTVLESSVYCNTLNLVYVYAFLVKITEFWFAHISCVYTCTRVNFILCTPPFVWRMIYFLRVFS